MPLRIYLANGEREVTEHDGELELVGITNDGKRTLKDIRELKPDVAVLGMAMEGITGIQVVAALKAEGINTKILFTGPETREAMLTAMATGANGYLPSRTDWTELRRALLRIASGEFVVAPDMIAVLAGELRSIQVEETTLTARETMVLSLLAEDYDTNAIAKELNLAEGTVRKYMRSVCTKLCVTSWLGAVAEGMRRGLVD